MFEAALYVLEKMVPKMVERDLTRATCHCRACGGKDTVLILRQRKPGSRGQVVRWHCRAEGCGNRGMT
jgi:hypothetical protein